jgi:hypothetical protein
MFESSKADPCQFGNKNESTPAAISQYPMRIMPLHYAAPCFLRGIDQRLMIN